MTRIITKLTILIQNGDDLNSPIKRCRTMSWIKKQDWPLLPTRINLTIKNKHWLRVKTLLIFQANGPQSQAAVGTLIADQVDLNQN
jgi:hypothetical protein